MEPIEGQVAALRRLSSAEIATVITGTSVSLADIVGTGSERFFIDGRYEARAHTPVSGHYKIADDALCVFIGTSREPSRCYALLRSPAGVIFRSQLDANLNAKPSATSRLNITKE